MARSPAIRSTLQTRCRDVVTLDSGATAALIALSTEPDLCNRIGSNIEIANERVLTIILIDATSSGAPTGPGTFTVALTQGSNGQPSLFASLQSIATDEQCQVIDGTSVKVRPARYRSTRSTAARSAARSTRRSRRRTIT